MSTSLREQLNRLAVPQTSALTDFRRKASILFDPKEAATKDRKTIYDLGFNGLQELIGLNSSFQQFESTLFDEETLHLERSVEHRDVNELLNKNIRKFLQRLSPYFMLRPAHMCIEWLLRRFQVQDYNKPEFLALILPYHETNIFVKCLQTIRIKQTDEEYNWLKPLQKAGKMLSKTALLNRAASNPAFLSFVCDSTVAAITELGKRAHLLQAQINFYASVVVGALEFAPAIKEWHITSILLSLIKGLSSDVVDYTSAAYIIASQLVSRTQLTLRLLEALIAKVAAVHFEQLRTAAVLLLILIFDKQAEMKPNFTNESLLSLVQHKWLTGVISTLAKEGVAVHYLCIPLLRGSVQAIQQKHKSADVLRLFMERLLYDVVFSPNMAQEIIRGFLDCFIEKEGSSTSKKGHAKSVEDNGVIELDSDDDMDNNDSFQSWYSDYLKKLERQYPVAFDQTIKDALKSNSQQASNRSKAIKMALGYRLKSFDENSTDIYENLYHHVAKIRLLAIQALIGNLGDYQAKPQNYHLLKECLADRIADDSELVVAEVLKLPTEDFIKILGYENFVEQLLSILFKAQLDNDKWSKLMVPVVRHITSQSILDNYDANLILLALMPLLFPYITKSKEVAYKHIKEILKSPLVDKVIFLKDLKIAEKSSGAEFSPSEFKRQFLDVISHTKHAPTALEFLKSIIQQQKSSQYFKLASHFAYFLMLMTACIKEQLNSEESLWIITHVLSYCEHFKPKHMENQDWQQINKHNFIPLLLFADFLQTLMRKTKFENLQNWENSQDSPQLKCFMKVFNLLMREAFSNENPKEKVEWTSILRVCFNSVFKSVQDKIDFLTNFYVNEELDIVEQYIELRLRSFKILNSILQNKQNKCIISTEHILKTLIALMSQYETLRLQALETLKCMLNIDALDETLAQFIQSILERRNEISMDHEQIPLVLYAILKPTQKKIGKQIGPIMLKKILKSLEPQDAGNSKNVAFKCEILKLLKHVNDETILAELLTLALNALNEYNSDGVKQLREPYATIFRLVCERFDSQTIENVLVDKPEAWQLFTKIFEYFDVFLLNEGKLLPLPCVLLDILNEFSFEKMPDKFKIGLIKLIIKTVALAENDTIFLGANKLLKKCLLDCQPFVELLKAMCKKTIGVAKSSQRKTALHAQLEINSIAWKEGVVLLELLENKKKLLHAEKIIPVHFELLELCLEVEEQSSVEYVKQLILSTLLHCCQKAQLENINLQTALPKTTFRIDQIVQCVRASQNPQTHHHALLLLSHCAGLFPQQVLHNIVDIFTFMGSTVVRNDDAFSFHIINNIIESIVPILVVKSGSSSSNAKSAVIPVLKVFSDIMLDVPEHRRLPLYTKLLNTLNAEQFLWMFLCVVFEAHVIDDEKLRMLRKKSITSSDGSTSNSSHAIDGDKSSKRLEIAINLTVSFAPHIALQTCVELLNYINNLPQSKAQTLEQQKRGSTDSYDSSLFDVNCHTAIQLRHYKYVIMQFISTFTASPDFLRSIAILSDEEVSAMKPYYKNLIIKTLSYVPVVNAALEKLGDDNKEIKFWKVILHHVHDVLDNAISLLSPDMFLVVINGLMQHQLLSIRKKVIELLYNKLQQRDSYFDACDDKHFKNLLKPLSDIAESILQKDESITTSSSSSSSNELVYLQQTALIAIKMLSKLFALKHIEDFKNILAILTKIAKKRTQVSKIVFATVILTLIEISSNLKAHSLAYLSKFMPQLIEVLEDQTEFVRKNAPDHVSLAIITGMQKLFESLPLFLGPYTVDVITRLSSISTNIETQQLANQTKELRSTNALHKISNIWTKIATEIPARILVPSCEKSYNKLMATKHYPAIGVLMKLLLECITNSNVTDLASVQIELCNFFMHTLEFRTQLSDAKTIEISQIIATEACIIDAFVAWVLKLSESSFRPIYYKLYEWAFKREAQNETKLTYFLLTRKISEALKGLFVLFAGDFLQDAADSLEKNNSTKNEIDGTSEHVSIELVKSILCTLQNVFLHDSKGFINTNRFEILMQPIVDQLENRLTLENEELQQALITCIAQLAVTVSNDVMWKQLNQQVLLKTRTNIPEVRILSFNCCIEIARKLGDDFTTLLPETVPFVAELFEDENPRVEKNTRKAVQELEGILGESLQKYL